MAKNNSEVIEVLVKKFELSKALAEIRAKLTEAQDKRKLDYATYLYGLKSKYSDKLYEQSMQRLKYLHEEAGKKKRRRK
jgi:hypothetical protein